MRSRKESADRSPTRLWTIQTLFDWDRFRKTGVLRADGRRVWAYYHFAYRWMMGQMEARLPEYSGRYPIWAWYQPKPDLRSAGYLERGLSGVRIEFVVPRPRILLSDFDGWHFVLNRWYLALTQREDREWERRLPEGKFRYEDLLPKLQHEIVLSWDGVFDLNSLRVSRWVGSGNHIQAVLEEVRLDEVIAVREFVGR